MIRPGTLVPFLPASAWFRHNPYGIHGVAHAARVLVWAEVLAGTVAGPQAIDRDALRWAAACHDIGRENDGIDPQHPARAAAWVLAKLRTVRPTATEVDVDRVAELCRWHTSSDRAVPRMTLELLILKDADALDRARLGDLDPGRLRLARARDVVALAEELYRRTGEGPEATGERVLAEAAELLGR
jgi:hypothetical protein